MTTGLDLVLHDPTGGPPRWSPGERMHHLLAACADARPDAVAVELPDGSPVTRAELQARANRLAHHLHDVVGVAPGALVALLLEEPLAAYVAVLAVLEAGAAYVPLDPDWPDERLRFVAEDCGAVAVVSEPDLAARAAAMGVEVVLPGPEVERQPATRLGLVPAGDDELAYAIYTSGTTGRPKGVPIRHSSIVSFLRVAAEHYGYAPGDRVYQGLTMAFDFAVEETWVPLLAGATLVPRPVGVRLAGDDLADHLERRGITALCCVPTLLSSVGRDVPSLRLLLTSGEACPPDLVRRWWRPGRRMLNLYGPTETTVSCTWTELHPDEPVTIGVPLPTYSAVVLHPDRPEPLPHGEAGELAIAGIGLSPGYLHRPEATARAFVPDVLGLPDNPSGRLYRTGDLCRVDGSGRLEYLGRIDTQVKLRGYRIDLGEVEAVLREQPGVRQAAVAVHADPGGRPELAAWVAGPAPVDLARVHAALRERLPRYMLPAWLEQLPAVPMLPSGKVDRAALPAPSTPRVVASTGPVVAPATATETTLVGLLAGQLGLDEADLSVEADLFDELGANSLVVARWCAELRVATGRSGISTRDAYRLRTVRALAAEVDAAPDDAPSAQTTTVVLPARWRVAAFGAAQVAVVAAAGALGGEAIGAGVRYAEHGDRVARALVVALLAWLVLHAVPLALKWGLVGRWRDGDVVPLWGMRHLRYWLVTGAARLAPASRSHGPLLAGWLRLQGARIGRGTVLLAREPVVAPDLLAIGDGAVLDVHAVTRCGRAERRGVVLGRVEVGAWARVGATSVLDIGSSLGEGAELLHASALHTGQHVPAGERWHGSPAEPAGRAVAAARALPARRRRAAAGLGSAASQVLRLALAVGVVEPLSRELRPHLLLDEVASLVATAAVVATVGLGLELLAVVVGSRVLGRAVRVDVREPMHGWRWAVVQVLRRVSNRKLPQRLMGDSSAVTGLLAGLGYELGEVVQTGSNFGTWTEHDVPGLCEVSAGTMVSDALLQVNLEVDATGFVARRTRLGERSFLGNHVTVPAAAALGDDVLLATKVLVPVDGPPRAGVGLLGSPVFEIPRHVERDEAVNRDLSGPALRAALEAKDRFNRRTRRWYVGMLAVEVLAGVSGTALAAAVAHDSWWLTGAVALPLDLACVLLALALVERVASRHPTPAVCSIYDEAFWRHERYWKASSSDAWRLLHGTAFAGLGWRLLGARVGRAVFDEGCQLIERKPVRIGDGALLNWGSCLSGHSLEDGVFKSGPIAIGAGAVVGVRGFVLYGSELGDGAELAADAFLLKGERVPAGARWAGNPAGPVAATPGPPASVTTAAATPTAAPVTTGATSSAVEPELRAEPVDRALQV